MCDPADARQQWGYSAHILKSIDTTERGVFKEDKTEMCLDVYPGESTLFKPDSELGLDVADSVLMVPKTNLAQGFPKISVPKIIKKGVGAIKKGVQTLADKMKKKLFEPPIEPDDKIHKIPAGAWMTACEKGRDSQQWILESQEGFAECPAGSTLVSGGCDMSMAKSTDQGATLILISLIPLQPFLLVECKSDTSCHKLTQADTS